MNNFKVRKSIHEKNNELMRSTPSEKAELVRRISEAIERGEDARSVYHSFGVPRATFYKWRRKLEEGGVDALVDRKPTGRPPKFTLSADEENILRWYVLQKESLPVAVQKFVADERVSDDARNFLVGEMETARRERRRVRFPVSVRRAGHVTPEERCHFRGSKASQDLELVVSRGLTWVDHEGRVRPLHANDVWESDDMSSNEPFVWVDTSTGDEMRGRQTLTTIDVYSHAWLGAQAVGRPGDAYRAEDIADHFRNCVEAWGLPLVWRIERGRWENNFIDGLKLDSKRAHRYGLGGERFDGVTWGGLGEIVHIVHTWSSRGKGTQENAYDHLQTLTAHESLSIGRRRGEFEAATKAFMAAGRGKDSALRKFWSIDEYTEALADWMEFDNSQGKTRQAFGKKTVVPSELFADHPPRREVPAGEEWRLLPFKDLATVRKGRLSLAPSGWDETFHFQVNGVLDGLHVAHGTKVLIAYHPGEIHRGCWVFNAELGASNRAALPFGAPMLVAPVMEAAPQVALVSTGDDRKKRANATSRAAFRSIRDAGKPADPVTAQHARDGMGNALSIRTGAKTVEPEIPVVSGGRETEPSPGRGDDIDLEKLRPKPKPRRRVDRAALAAAEADAFDAFTA